MPTIYTTTTWKFYTYSEKVKVKCSKCGKTITKTVSTEYREDSKPDYEYIEKRKQEILNEEHICNSCLKKAAKSDKEFSTIDISNELTEVDKAYEKYAKAKEELYDVTSVIEEKIKNKVIKYNNDEYVYNYVWSDDGFVTIGCYRVSKTEPWRLTDKEMRIRNDLAKGKSNRWSLSLQDVIITDEVFSERRKRVKSL